MHAKIGFLDEDAGPNQIDQFSPAHDLTRPAGQRNQNVESAAADGDRFVIPEQHPLCPDQAKGAERQGLTRLQFAAICDGGHGETR
ncbi:hypothetical protein ACFSQT_21020 [Mesorhizobium calcicola]|uniref:Uncharacterized protein n=1 Tax=Mesorhizobium calcicola TaxID=1300310 RepID=A0ABW4WG02_9HYPH